MLENPVAKILAIILISLFLLFVRFAPATYDGQLSETFYPTQNINFTQLSFNVTAVAQTTSDGIGPAYLLNGLTDVNGIFYWYQVSVLYNFDPSHGVTGFQLGYNVFNASHGNQINPPCVLGCPAGHVSFSGPVYTGDKVQLKLYFSKNSNLVMMNAMDLNTKSSASTNFTAYSANKFVSGGISTTEYFFTGLMTEQYHNSPYYGDEQPVAYQNSSAINSTFLIASELNTSNNKNVFASSKFLTFVSNNSTQLQTFFNKTDGFVERADAYKFITGNYSLTLSVPNDGKYMRMDQGQTLTINETNAENATNPTTYQWLEWPAGKYYYADAVDCGAADKQFINNTVPCTFSTNSVTPTGSYSFKVMANDSASAQQNAGSVISPYVNVSLYSSLGTPTISPQNAKIYDGQSITLTANETGGVGGSGYGYDYQWYTLASNGSYVPYGGQVAYKTLEVSPSSTTTYKVRVIDIGALGPLYPTANSSPDTVTVYPDVAITLRNSQPVATPAPFQAKLDVNSYEYGQYEAGDLDNVAFLSISGINATVIPSWLESGNSNTSTDTVYWLLLKNGIPAGSNVIVYMGFLPTNEIAFNNYSTGEAPQLSLKYGQYDDGSNVFPYYQSFGSLTSLPSQWSSTGGISLTYGTDYLSIANSTGGFSGLWYNAQAPVHGLPVAYDWYGSISGTNTATYIGLFPLRSCITWGYLDYDGTASLDILNNGSGSYPMPPSPNVYTITSSNGASPSNNGPETFSVNYAPAMTASLVETANVEDPACGGTAPEMTFQYNVPSKLQTLYWVRERMPPPDGVMPSQSTLGSFSMPAGVKNYVNITLTNAQPVATHAPFQQRLSVDSGEYRPDESANLNNVEFFYANSTVIPSWLESGNSNASAKTTYWLDLAGGIPASSSIKIYMGFRQVGSSALNNATTGEAPWLSAAYGQYDNGGAIFPFYQRFGGLSGGALPKGWSDYGATITNNKNSTTVQDTGSSGCGGIAYSSPPLGSLPVATDWLESVVSGPNDGTAQGFFGLCSCITLGTTFGGSYGDQVSMDVMNNGTAWVSNPTSTNPTAYTLVSANPTTPTNTGPERLRLNYNAALKAAQPLNANLTYCSAPDLSLQFNLPNDFATTLYYWRERYPPPNDVMPSTSVQAPPLAYYLPMNITNKQTAATPAPFQEGFAFNSLTFKKYENGTLSNIAFYYQNGTPLDSWLESGNSNTAIDTVYWLGLPGGLKAGASMQVIMGFAPIGTIMLNGNTTGESPQLSSTYAQYDNGFNIFNKYWDFNGTVLPGDWVDASGGTVGNGIAFSNATSSSASFYIKDNFTIPFVFDAYSYIDQCFNNYNWNVGNTVNPSGTYSVANAWGYGCDEFEYDAEDCINGYCYSGGLSSFSTVGTWSTDEVTVYGLPSSNLTMLLGNGYLVTEPDKFNFTRAVYLSTDAGGVPNRVPAAIKYALIRAYPPNDIMPNVTDPAATLSWLGNAIELHAPPGTFRALSTLAGTSVPTVAGSGNPGVTTTIPQSPIPSRAATTVSTTTTTTTVITTITSTAGTTTSTTSIALPITIPVSIPVAGDR